MRALASACQGFGLRTPLNGVGYNETHKLRKEQILRGRDSLGTDPEIETEKTKNMLETVHLHH